MSHKLWFKTKTYGWGWTPSSWEGWTVLLGYVLMLTVSTLWVEKSPLGYAALLVFSTILLLWICFKKGEKPRWRWGK